MNPTPFTTMDQDFGAAFGSGIQTAITSLLAAVASPLLACVTLWIVIQGILIMRGDLDVRGGVTRMIKVAFVVGILTSTGLYTTYVQTAFMTTIPNWLATAAGGSASPTSTPQTFDNMWQVTEHTIENVSSKLSNFDVIDSVSLAVIEICVAVLLLITFAIYEFSIIVIGIMVAIGPILIVGYLFDATKAVTDRWIGKLITYSLLSLLINVTLNTVLQGEKLYMRAILTQEASGAAAIPVEIKILLSLTMFLAMGAFIIVSLPVIAATLGGGLGISPGAGLLRAITSVASSGAARMMPTPKGKA
jgi:type IV secretion system protein VirB6